MEDEKLIEYGTEERRNKILEILTRQGKVKVNQLSRLFEISEVTIRSDLAKLESMGLLERVHGGAVSTYRAYYRMSISDRMKANAEEKRRIAAEVASMISDDDTLMISSGTTTLYVLEELKNAKNLTIVTNAIYFSQESANLRDFNIILLGGILEPRDQFTYGDDVINQVKRYKADKFILSVDGINSEDGISTYHYLEAEINRQMIARANKTIVVGDYTKVGRTSFAHISPLENVDVIVTNKNANEDEINEIKEKGVEVRQV
ncbi:MAG TPA: DeoR/GlpR family DNA-binding transcription regulator [Clostridiales bacterium]|nr:DeoR/GlpR family DNA-binding transcription regulator [Clostridiales bacterium]